MGSETPESEKDQLSEEQEQALAEAAAEETAPGSEELPEEVVSIARLIAETPHEDVKGKLKGLPREQVEAGFMRTEDYSRKTAALSQGRKKLAEEEAALGAKQAAFEERERQAAASDQALLDHLADMARKHPELTVAELMREENNDVDDGDQPASKEVAKLRNDVTSLRRQTMERELIRDIEDVLDNEPDLVPSAKDPDATRRAIRRGLLTDIKNRYLLSEAVQHGRPVTETANQVLQERRSQQRDALALVVERHRKNRATVRREGAAAISPAESDSLYEGDLSDDDFIEATVREGKAMLAAEEEPAD